MASGRSEQEEFAGRVSSSPFERPRLAGSQLLRLRPGGVARALLSPDSLTPAERETWADKAGVGGSGLYKTLLRTIENPLVLWGAVMALRYPIPLAGEMFKFAPKFTGSLRKVGRLMRGVSGVDSLYHGTPIPELYKKILHETDDFLRTHSDKMGVAIEKYKKGGKVFGRREQVLLAAKLDGLDDAAVSGSMTLLRPIREGKGFDRLVSDIRGITDELYDKVFGNVKDRARLLALNKYGISPQRMKAIEKLKRSELTAADKGVLKKVSSEQSKISRGIHDQLRAAGIDPESFAGLVVKKNPKYFPRRIPRDEAEFAKQTTELLRATAEKEGAQHILASATTVTTPHVIPRVGRMVPNPLDLELVKDRLLDPTMVQRLGGAVKKGALPYSLKFIPTMEAYIQSLGRANAWTLKGYGTRIVQAVDSLMRPGVPGSKTAAGTALHTNNVVRGAMMRDSYIPLALGKMTFKQSVAAAKWSQSRMDFVENLATGPMGKMVAKAPGGDALRKWAIGTLEKDRGLLSLKNVSGRAASYLYLSALGMNHVSAMWNMMQTLLTTAPTIGAKYTYQGMTSVLQKAPKYFRLRGGGKSHEQALSKAFPQFFEEGLVASPVADEALMKSLSRSWEISIGAPKMAGKVDKVKDAMMALFQGSENLVRLTAWEGSMAKAAAEGLKLPEARFFARRVVETTQFLGGPANVPSFMREWNPLLRQFGTFPFRTVDFLMGPATQMGSAKQAGFLGRNWGTLGRVAATSGVAYEAGQELLGADLTHGLLFGALPVPNPRSPLSPIPFIPPVVGIAAAAGQDLLEGEIDQLRYVAPLAIPGGLAAARLSSIYAPGVAQKIGRGYADFDNKTPDGKIPVYTPTGNLRGYMSPLQVHMEMLGIPPGGDPGGRKEKELQKFLLSQRERIRAYRRSFLDALVNNETAEASAIQEEFEQVYPGMGGLKVKDNDFRAVHLRMMVPRLERMLESLPKEARPMFGQIISNAMMSEAEGLLGVDPQLLQQGSIRSRDPWRTPPPTSFMEAMHRKQQEQGLVAAPGSGGVVSTGPVGNSSRRGGGYSAMNRAKYGRQTSRYLNQRRGPASQSSGGFGGFGGPGGGF